MDGWRGVGRGFYLGRYYIVRIFGGRGVYGGFGNLFKAKGVVDGVDAKGWSWGEVGKGVVWGLGIGGDGWGKYRFKVKIRSIANLRTFSSNS